MIYEITDACSLCGQCAEECQIGAINDENGKYSISRELCVQCGACVFVCDVAAIRTTEL